MTIGLPRDIRAVAPRVIALTPELEVIIDRQRALRVEGCPLIFHHDGKRISDYRKCWHAACVLNGLGQICCRGCPDEDGIASVLDADRRCPKCGQKWARPKYMGKLFHDFRRSAAHEMMKGGSTWDDCMKVTGHNTLSMFRRYADLFSEEELREKQLEVQRRRREWRQAEVEQAASGAAAQQPSLSSRVQ